MDELKPYFKLSGPPDQLDYTRVFGDAAQGAGRAVVRLAVELAADVAGVGTLQQQEQQIKKFFNENAGEVAQVFKDAQVLTLDGLPRVFLGKLRKEVGVWVRTEDVSIATEKLRQQNWVGTVEPGQHHTIGAPIHR